MITYNNENFNFSIVCLLLVASYSSRSLSFGKLSICVDVFNLLFQNTSAFCLFACQKWSVHDAHSNRGKIVKKKKQSFSLLFFFCCSVLVFEMRFWFHNTQINSLQPICCWLIDEFHNVHVIRRHFRSTKCQKMNILNAIACYENGQLLFWLNQFSISFIKFHCENSFYAFIDN